MFGEEPEKIRSEIIQRMQYHQRIRMRIPNFKKAKKEELIS